MRVIASVQSKRGSSRGLIHYIAHSKIETTREPEKGRELFNAFADELSVKSANNSIKADIMLARPSNDELHHLVLSFRAEDYKALGRDEKRRRADLKETTRAAMKRLEKALDADRISWTAAVHRNTENPHVHIAIQKEFMSKDLDTQVMTKIPREALPHFEVLDGEKLLTPGILIDAATEKMDQLIAVERERETTREKEQMRSRSRSRSISNDKTDRETDSNAPKKTNDERDILRRGILAEQELDRIESRIETLTEHGSQMRFRVTDPLSGQKRRLSLQDLEQRHARLDAGSDATSSTPAERQIRTILLKMFSKEQAANERVQKLSSDTIREASELRKLYKKNGWKLPIPSLTKDELDKIQDHCLEDSNIRRFSYFEGIRTELERSGEIEPRSKKDIDRLAAEKTISEMRGRLLERNHTDLNDRQYYRLVDIEGRPVSLARLDRDENTSKNTASVFTQKLKKTALRLVGRATISPPAATENDRLRNEILEKIKSQLSEISKDQKTEGAKGKILENILTANPENSALERSYSSEHLGAIEQLSLKLGSKPDYETSWKEQRSLIESAANDCPAARKLYKVNPAADFRKHKDSVIAGRALAREIVAKVEFDKAKDALKTFTGSKSFQKFAIADKETGSISFLSLHDVDLSRRGSLLDRAMEEMFESREHRTLRRTVTSLVRDRDQRLTDEVAAAKGVAASAARDAARFKQTSFFGFISEPVHSPVFTSAEITAIEMRALNTKDPKEAARLENILKSASAERPRSLTEILRDFEDPPTASRQQKEHDTKVQTVPKHTAGITPGDQMQSRQKAEKVKEPKFQGYSR